MPHMPKPVTYHVIEIVKVRDQDFGTLLVSKEPIKDGRIGDLVYQTRKVTTSLEKARHFLADEFGGLSDFRKVEPSENWIVEEYHAGRYEIQEPAETKAFLHARLYRLDIPAHVTEETVIDITDDCEREAQALGKTLLFDVLEDEIVAISKQKTEG